jgi:hypothetical protein
MGVFPINREGLIHFQVLAGLNAAATENALIRIVAIERISTVNLVGFGTKRDVLMLDS